MLNNLAETFPVLKSLQFAMLALFIYDYLLTFPREIELMWSRRFRISTMIYFMTRYLPVINIAYAIAESPVTHCTWVLPFVVSWVIVVRVAINATLIARIYAICSLHYFIPSVAAVLGLLEIVFDSMIVSCHPQRRWQVATLVTRLMFEGMAIILTFVQTVRNYTLLNPLDGQNLAGFIVAHGIMSFVAVFSLEIVCFAVLKTQIQVSFPGSSGVYPLPVIAIIISRFHLDLRRMAQKSQREEDKSTTGGTLSSIHFISHQAISSFINDFTGPDTSENSQDDRNMTSLEMGK